MVSILTRQGWPFARHAPLDSIVTMWRTPSQLRALKTQTAIWVSKDSPFVRWVCTTTPLTDSMSATTALSLITVEVDESFHSVLQDTYVLLVKIRYQIRPLESVPRANTALREQFLAPIVHSKR